MSKKVIKKKVILTKKVEGSGDIHLMIDSPLTIRRELLSGAVSATKLMRNYETIKLLREKKENLFLKLDLVMKDIRSEFGNIEKEHLPEFKQEWVKMLEDETTISREEVKEVVNKEKPKQLTEIDRINKELEDIEKKLSAIS